MRITQEGIPTLFPLFISRLNEYNPDFVDQSKKSCFNIVELDRKNFVKLLQQEDVKMNQFGEKILSKMNLISHGCCILYIMLNRPSPNESSQFIVPICAWKGKNSVRAYVARNDRLHLLRLCGEEPETMITNNDKQNKGYKIIND